MNDSNIDDDDDNNNNNNNNNNNKMALSLYINHHKLIGV